MRRPYPYDYKILAYADIHHGSKANGRCQQDMLDAESQITQIAFDKKVNAVVFAGDAFKSRNPHDEEKTKYVESRIRRIHALPLNVDHIDIVGNHCRWYKANNSGHVLEAVAMFGESNYYLFDKQESRPIKGLMVHALPAQVDFSNEWKIDPNLINICVFHGMVKGCQLNNLDSKTPITAPAGIPLSVLDHEGFDFVIGGDIHIPQMLDFHNTVGGYTGSTLQLDEGDRGQDRGCLFIEFVKGETSPRVEFIPIEQSKLITIALSEDTADSIDESVFAGNLVKLVVSDAHGTPSTKMQQIIDRAKMNARNLVVILEGDMMDSVPLSSLEIIPSSPLEEMSQYLRSLSELDGKTIDRMNSILEETFAYGN